MRLRTVLSIAVFVALAACDASGPPKIGARQPAPTPGAVTVPVTTQVPAAVAPPATACPDPAQIIAAACPPAKVVKAPAKPIKIHHKPKPKPKKPVVRPVAPPPVEREYARVEQPAPPPPPPPRAQGRVVQEEIYESFRSYPAPPAYAPPPPPPPMAYYPPPPPPRVYMPPPPPPPVYYPPPPPSGPCCTYPAAGRDANGFLTWPGKR